LTPGGPGRSLTGRALSPALGPVTNSGSRAGAEVAQLYLGQPAANGEPPHQFQGFQRLTLDPGASATATFTLPMRAFAHWDTGWVATAGTYQILVGDSSRNLPLTGTETIPTTVDVPIA
jgi:beta-glucosidase